MEKWKHVTLGDVAELSGGYAFKSSQYTEQGRVVVRTINIRDDCSITLDGATYISEDDAAQFSKFSLRCMDTLFVMVAATLGKIGFVRSDVLPALLNQNMWIIRAKPGRIEPVFLHYCFRELSRIPLAWVSGSARSFLRRDDVRNLEFHLPPLTEQRAIAHILGTLDDKIELNRRMSETLEAMARALFKDWFVDFGPTRAKIEGRDPYLAPEIWDLFPDKLDADGKPEGWEVQSVIDQAEWVNGAAYRNMHFSNAPDALPVVKITELKAGVTENTKRTNTALADKYRISDREMLFAWSGNPDTSIDAFIWTGGNAWLNQHIFAVRDNGARTLAFLYIMLKLLKPEFSEIARNKQTTGLGHVTKQDLKRMRIHVGPTELVETFEHLVGPLHARMQGNLLENMTLANTRNLLLPKLISGEISIGHADKIVQEVNMSEDWYPGIKGFCAHWRHAPMLQQTFAALGREFADDNDACIDVAKAMVECTCRIIIENLDAPASPLKPKEQHPDFGAWMSAAVRVLELSEIRDEAFKKLISQYHKLATTLGDLRNKAGSVSHSKDGFISKLSIHQRRASLLAADAIITFLHEAYLERDPDPVLTLEPFERFAESNATIDEHTAIVAEADEDGFLQARVLLPNEDEISLSVEPSRLLFGVDRDAYKPALNACRDAVTSRLPVDEEVA